MLGTGKEKQQQQQTTKTAYSIKFLKTFKFVTLFNFLTIAFKLNLLCKLTHLARDKYRNETNCYCYTIFFILCSFVLLV